MLKSISKLISQTHIIKNLSSDIKLNTANQGLTINQILKNSNDTLSYTDKGNELITKVS